MTSTLPQIRVVSAEIARDGLYLLTQRLPHAVLPNLWEFPGGRVREGESDVDALHRAIHDRLGIEPVVGSKALEITHTYDRYTLTMAVYRCTLPDDVEPEPRKVADLAWVGPERFGDFAFPGADQQTVDALLRDLS